MMNKTSGRLIKKIAGGLLLILVLHYVLDEPTRSILLRMAFGPHRLTLPAPPQHNRTGDHLSPGLLNDPSFERWEGQQYPLLQVWSSSLTVSAWDVVKKETEIVRSGDSAVRLECDSFHHCGNVQQELPQEAISRLRGQRLQFSVWILSTTPQVPCLHIHEEKHAESKACLENPSGAWQLLTVERLISPEATRVVLMIQTPELATMAPVYVDNASLTEIPPSADAP
jgi:hypothetical protein